MQEGGTRRGGTTSRPPSINDTVGILAPSISTDFWRSTRQQLGGKSKKNQWYTNLGSGDEPLSPFVSVDE